MGVVIMQGVPKIFGALRSHLCDSIAFLFPFRLTRVVCFLTQQQHTHVLCMQHNVLLLQRQTVLSSRDIFTRHSSPAVYGTVATARPF